MKQCHWIFYLQLALILLLPTAGLSAPNNGEKQPPIQTATADYVIATFDAERASLRDVVSLLREDDVRICLECDSNVAYEPLTVHLAHATVSQILSRVATIEPRLRWDYDEGLNVFNVYPVEGCVLDWVVPSYRIRNKSSGDAISDQDHRLGLAAHGIGLFYVGDSHILKSPVTVSLKQQTARKCLNAIVTQTPQDCWTVVTNKFHHHILFIDFIPYNSIGIAQTEQPKR